MADRVFRLQRGRHRRPVGGGALAEDRIEHGGGRPLPVARGRDLSSRTRHGLPDERDAGHTAPGSPDPFWQHPRLSRLQRGRGRRRGRCGQTGLERRPAGRGGLPEPLTRRHPRLLNSTSKPQENIEQQNKEPQNFEGKKVPISSLPTFCGSIFLVQYSIFSFLMRISRARNEDRPFHRAR